MKRETIIFLLFLHIFSTQFSICASNIVCYYTNWSQYRPAPATFTPSNIDPNLCDVIIFSFAGISATNQITTTDTNDLSMISLIVALKTQNPNLKVMIAVGGGAFPTAQFSTLVSNPTSRAQFIKSAVQFLTTNKLDGLDVDWEYPNSGGSSPSDTQFFTTFLSELRTAFGTKFLLTAAVVAETWQANLSYLDWINLMTYDYHGTWETFTGFNAPLYNRSGETSGEELLNVNAGVQLWISKGFPRNKIVLGMATYGRSYTLTSATNFLPGSASTGAGTAGTYTASPGFFAYYEICTNLKNGWTSAWQAQQLVPYVYNGNQWAGYDNITSLQNKTDYVITQGLLGAMFWALDFDDFTGTFCGQGKYPLINAVKQGFATTTAAPTTTKATTTVTTPTTTKATTTITTPTTTKATTTVTTPTTTKATTTITTPTTTKATTTVTTPTTTKATTTITTSTTTKATTLTTTTTTTKSNSTNIACYYTSWSQYNPGNTSFTPSKIDPSLCNIIIFAYLEIVSNQIATAETNDISMLTLIKGLKQNNTNLKVMVSVGGANVLPATWSSTITNSLSRQQFINSTVNFLKNNALDGLDVDWEFPATTQKALFITLLSELKSAFLASGRDLLLTASVSAERTTIDQSYLIPNISQNVNFINLMSYDLHGSWDGFTGFNAPLYNRTGETGGQELLNVNAAVQYWISKGFPRNKILLGLAGYARTFTLQNIANFLPGNATIGDGTQGPYTGSAGTLAYYEVCLINKTYTAGWQAQQLVPYLYKGNQWAGFDNVLSLQYKVNYTKSQNLGGVNFWTFDYDDFVGSYCNQGKYPLLKAVKQTLLN